MNLGIQLCVLLAICFASGNSAIISFPEKDTIFLANGNNTKLELSCMVEAAGLTDGEVVWNTVDTTSAKLKVSYNTDGNTIVKKTLTFSKFDATKDAGVYICTYKTESVKFELIGVTEIKEEPEYDFNNKSITELTLTCDVDAGNRMGGEPVEVDNIKWFQNDIEVTQIPKDASRFIVAESKLTIKDVSRADANQYYAQYTFKGQDQYNCSVALRAKPLVLDFEKSKNLIQDEKMELQCNVLGFPKAIVSWFKDGTQLVMSDKEPDLIMSPLNGYMNARLTIKEVDYDDAGEYKCVAFEASFNVNTTKVITVRVKDKLAALWPFLGIVGEVIVLCAIIFIYEKRRNKQAEQAENDAQEADYAEKKGNVRNRRNLK